MASEPPSARPSARDPTEDIVADRGALVSIGMAAVFFACVVFGTLRFVAHLTTGRETPFWGNVAAGVGIALLFAWFRGDRERRSAVGVHGTALMATLALLVPAAYGMTSSKWWLTLVGFSVVLMGRRGEAIVWTAITLVLVPSTALLEPYLTVPNSIGEPPVERAMAGLIFVVLLLGVTFAFRRVAQRRAQELSETAASLDRANRVKSRFLAHMSHDLRTPLHGVIALTDLAKTGDASPAVHEQVAVAQQSAQMLLGILNDILDVTRAEAGAIELDSRPFPLHTALEELLPPFAAQARAKGLALVARSEAGVFEQRVGDRTRVRQIVLNLLGNALKFTDRGRVELRVANVAGASDLVEIQVTDTGRGIADDKLATVFEPFRQSRVDDASLQGGAGLGLAIVRELARCMGGGVDVRSVLGQGTTFTVRLRLPSAPGATAGPLDLAGAGPAMAATRSRGRASLRVLACEDNPVNQLALRAMLDRLGHDHVIVDDGLAAWRRIEGEEFDVLLTDVEMPGLDGVELTRRIRERERARDRPRLPIVGATAHVSEAERHRLLEAEMDEHLPKPFTVAELADVLEAVSPLARALPASPSRTASTSKVREEAEPKVFDAEVLADFTDLAGDDGPLLLELAGRYAKESARILEELRGAAARGDRATVPRLAHSLVSGAASLGLSRVAALARAMETSETFHADAVAGLERESLLAVEALTAFVRSHADAGAAITAPAPP